MIAEFKEREKTRIAQLVAAAQAKHAEKAAAAAEAAASAANSAAAARVEAAPADKDQRRSPRKEAERTAAMMVGSPAAPVDTPAGQHGTRRSATVWAAFDTTGAPCVARRAASFGRTTLQRTACAGWQSPSGWYLRARDLEGT